MPFSHHCYQEVMAKCIEGGFNCRLTRVRVSANMFFRGKITSVCGKNLLDSKSHRKIPAEQQKVLDFFHKNVVLHQWFILNTPSLSSTVIHTSKTSLLILLCYQRNSLQLFRGKKSLRHCTFVNPIPQHSNTI